MADHTWTPRSRTARRILEEEAAKHLPPAVARQPQPGPAPEEDEAAVPAMPAEAPQADIDLDVFRAEMAFLAGTEPEAFLKGLMLECRELVRGSAAIISNPQFSHYHDDHFRVFQGAAQICSQLTDAIVKLRQGPEAEERRQRIIVERVERRTAQPGEGAARLPENE